MRYSRTNWRARRHCRAGQHEPDAISCAVCGRARCWSARCGCASVAEVFARATMICSPCRRKLGRKPRRRRRSQRIRRLTNACRRSVRGSRRPPTGQTTNGSSSCSTLPRRTRGCCRAARSASTRACSISRDNDDHGGMRARSRGRPRHRAPRGAAGRSADRHQSRPAGRPGAVVGSTGEAELGRSSTWRWRPSRAPGAQAWHHPAVQPRQ